MRKVDWLAKRNRDRRKLTEHLIFMPRMPSEYFTLADKYGTPRSDCATQHEVFPDLSPEDVADMRSGLLAARMYL